MAKKIKESQETTPQGLAGVVRVLHRVRQINDDEQVPAGAEILPDDSKEKLHDWQEDDVQTIGYKGEA